MNTVRNGKEFKLDLTPQQYYYTVFLEDTLSFWRNLQEKRRPSPHDYIFSFRSVNKVVSKDLNIALKNIRPKNIPLFLSSLTCTILYDQQMEKHFPKEYEHFDTYHKLPKFTRAGKPQNPWLLLDNSVFEIDGYDEGLLLGVFDKFTKFDALDARKSINELKYEKATWQSVKEALLRDFMVGRGKFGKIFKKNLMENPADKEHDSFFDKIRSLFDYENYEESLTLLNHFLAENIYNMEAKMWKALALKKTERYLESITLYTECLSDLKRYDFLWKCRADCYFEMKELRLALEDYKIALNLNPENVSILEDLALCLFLMKDFLSAHSYIDKAILLEKNSELPMVRKAQFFEYQLYPEKALEQYVKTVERFPDSEFAKEKIEELSRKIGG